MRFTMLCPSLRRSLMRVLTLVEPVNSVRRESVTGFPLFRAASIFCLVCFMVVLVKVVMPAARSVFAIANAPILWSCWFVLVFVHGSLVMVSL